MPTFEMLRREPEVRLVTRGETIFQAGDPGDCLYAVIEGAVEIELAGTVVERITPVGIFGEMALIDRLPRSATARAAEDCRLAVINEKRFLRLIEQTPRFALQVMQVITDRLRRARAMP
jgi:CRP-like cAMP-binding protein